jgi:prepilin-type N-terminal cleavage/methylation domain-containing protein
MRSKNGFTLIEIIMAMVLIGIISAVVATVIAGGMNSWIFMKGQKDLMADASSTMRRMVREIKMIRSPSIEVFASAECRFIDINNNSIDYVRTGNNLVRNGSVLLGNLAANGLQFSYYDNGGAAATLARAIKVVNISLIVQQGSNRVRLQSAAGIRNM